jgi:hypothetical protein
MGLREIRHQVTGLCWRLLMGAVDEAPEWNEICEFDRRATVWDWEKSEGFEGGSSARGDVQEQLAASFASTQRRADVPPNKCFSATDVARVLGRNSSATISNVLVLGRENSTPLKRMEIRLEDPKEVPATLNLLAVALQRSGIDCRAVRHPGIPATEIWLTSPLRDGKKTLLSCAATVDVQVSQGVAAKAGSPQSQAL